MVSVIKGSTVLNTKGMKTDSTILTFSRYSDARVSEGMGQFEIEKRGHSGGYIPSSAASSLRVAPSPWYVIIEGEMIF